MPQHPRSVKDLDFAPVGDVFPSPPDWRDVFIYQLLIDRFDNDDANVPGFDPDKARRQRDAKQGGIFQGGNLKGIIRRLDYIHKLGCNAIWISPPFKNRQDDPYSYHGYGIQDFLAIDPRFGTLQDFQQLVREAHKRKMYVILDVVINHAGDLWMYENDEQKQWSEGKRYEFAGWRLGEGKSKLGVDDAIWPVELQDPEVFAQRGRMRDLGSASGDEQYDGDFMTLKALDLTRPDVVDAMIAIYKYWIAVADVDGFRIDTFKHVRPEAAGTFCHAIREFAMRIGKHNFIQFGEIAVGSEELLRYVGSNTPLDCTDVARYPFLDAALDFPMYHSLDEILKGQTSAQELRDRVKFLHDYYRDPGEAGQYYVGFVDNHDQPSRPYRRFLHGVEDKRLAVIASAYILTHLCIPCIYYGTEQGFDGGGESDAYVREAMFGGQWGAFDTTGMHFFNSDNPQYRDIARIAKVRAAEPALRYGRQYFRKISDNAKDFGHPTTGQYTLAFSRVLDTEELLVCLNLDANARQDCILVDGKLSPPGTKMRDLLAGDRVLTVEKSENGTVYVRAPLEGHQVAILKSAR